MLHLLLEFHFLEYLERWVEKGQAPDVMIGSRVRHDAPLLRSITFPLPAGKIEYTRPHFPYPGVARYKGVGDPNDAANFERTYLVDEK